MRLTLGRSVSSNAARHARVAFALSCLAIALVGCQPSATVGVYSDAGVRCDPLVDGCGAGRACSLRADPTLDACREVDGVPEGEPCTTPDACAAGSQCVVLVAEGASLEPTPLAPGTCARICARDVPSCEPTERCAPILSSSGVRIDYGACGP